jgi:hypothetical protein
MCFGAGFDADHRRIPPKQFIAVESIAAADSQRP